MVLSEKQISGNRSLLFSLSGIESPFSPEQFVRCHNSYLVNVDYIWTVEKNRLNLKNGESIPVGRKYYNDFQDAFIRRINQ